MAASASGTESRRCGHSGSGLEAQILERPIQFGTDLVEHFLAGNQVVCEDPSLCTLSTENFNETLLHMLSMYEVAFSLCVIVVLIFNFHLIIPISSAIISYNIN